MKPIPVAGLISVVVLSLPAVAADMPSSAAYAPAPGPMVSVTGAATAIVQNDRMHASLRAEVDSPTATAGANEINAKIAQALARAKAVQGVEARTAGYSTWQISEKGKPVRWHVTQTLMLEGSDFAQLATLVTRLQEDGLLLSGMSFSVRPDTRRRTEEALTQQAIKAWQARAELAAASLGYGGWRPGRVTVSSGDAIGRPEPMFRAQAAAAAPIAPVAVEGGTTDITITVSGDAVLDKPAPR